MRVLWQRFDATTAKRHVTGGHGTELGVEHETHGDQVAVENRPYEHVDDAHGHLGDVDERPDGTGVVHGQRDGKLHVVDGGAVPSDGAVQVGDGDVLVDEKRQHDPHDQRGVAEGDERPEQRGQRDPAPAERGRVAAAALGVPVTGRVHHPPQPVRVGHHHVALECAHHSVYDDGGHVREPLQVVERPVQPGHLERVQGERQSERGHQRAPGPVAVTAAVDRTQQLVQSDGLEQRHVHYGGRRRMSHGSGRLRLDSTTIICLLLFIILIIFI